MEITPDPLSSYLKPIEVESKGIQSRQTVAIARRKDRIEDPTKDFLALAQQRFRKVCDSENEWRKLAEEELDFVDNLEHWTPAQRTERAGRPCHTFDRIGPSIDQVVNNARQDPPEPKVKPVGSGADEESAQIVQGLIRNISNDSQGDIAFMTAYEHAVKIGRGWFRISSDYESNRGDLQKLTIGRIPNPFSVYPDPAADKFDYSDMRYCFVTEDLDLDVFEELYPDAGSSSPFEGAGDKLKNDWYPNGCVRVAEYWHVTEKKSTLCTLANGTSVDKSKLPEGVVAVGERPIIYRKVRGAKITGSDILVEWEWPGQWIPLIPVIGREILNKGKRRLRGMIRPAMEANLQYDYIRSKMSEAVGLAPVSQWLVAFGQTEEWNQVWADANRKAYTVLPYKPISESGTQVPPPIRISPASDVSSLVQATQMAEADLQATLSTYPPSLGDAPPDASGVAITARARQSDNAHFHYHDNLSRSMQHASRQFVDLIPFYYDETRALTIYDPDGSSRMIQANGPVEGFLEKGAAKIYDLKNGGLSRYDVVEESGPTYATRRKEGAAALLELTRTIPQAMMRAVDLIVKTLDIPDSDALAKRLMPPDVAANQESGPDVPDEVKQQVQSLQQLVQQLQGALKEATDVNMRERLELGVKAMIAGWQEETKLNVAFVKKGSDEAIAQLTHEMNYLRDQLKLLATNPETANPELPPPPQQGPPMPQGPPPQAPPMGALPQQPNGQP